MAKQSKRVPHFKQGQKLTGDWTKLVASKLNEDVAEFADVSVVQPYGYIDSAHTAYTLFEFDVDATNALQRNSVLSIKLKKPADTSRELMTCGSRSVAVNVPVPLVVLAPGQPYMLQASAAPNAPVKGQECGVKDGHVLDDRGSGFTALSAPFTVGSLSLVWARFNSGGGSSTTYLKLAEDHLPGRNWIYAYQSDVSGTVSVPAPTPVKVYFAGSLMSGARLDYLLQANKIAGEWNFAQGDCISTTCGSTNGSSIQPGSPPVGVVGTAYSHTITQSGLSGAITATALPPGVTFSGSAFSGTPTQAGEYFVKLVGPKTVNSTSCPVTRLVRIQIDEA